MRSAPVSTEHRIDERSMPVAAGPDWPLGLALTAWRKEAHFGRLRTPRYTCNYFVWGRGAPIIFIHGLADRARSFVPLIAGLRTEFTALAYDLPNGDDGAALARYCHSDYVADLLAVLDHHRWRQAYLFGSSFGSTVALAALAAAPERFPRAILQGGFAYRPLSRCERWLSQWLRYRRGRLGEMRFRRQLQARLEQRENGVFERLGRREFFQFLAANSGEVAVAAAARRALLLDRLDLRPMLPRIPQPVMLVSGECDSLVPADCEQTLLDRLPHAGRIVIPQCGHYPQYTHTALLTEIVRQFLTAPPCPGSAECGVTPGAACPASPA